MNEFILDLTTLRPTLNRVEVEAAARDLELPDAEWRGSVRGVFRIERTGDTVSIRGEVIASAHLECVRCLREFDLELVSPVTLLAERSSHSARGEQIELEREAHMLFHDGRRLDLRGSAREALLLEMPISPHCREDCRGLCPKCGEDRNEGPCACESASRGNAGDPAVR